MGSWWKEAVCIYADPRSGYRGFKKRKKEKRPSSRLHEVGVDIEQPGGGSTGIEWCR